MQINIGTPDRVIRLILGVVLVVLPFVARFSVLWTWIAVILGLVLIVTAALRFCPIYAVLGTRTGGGR